jgi:thiamine biosynthesis lipoprotein
MGSDVHVVAVDGPVWLVETARELIDDLEAKWSRFRPTSEVSLMNTLAGLPVRVSWETITLVRRALEGVALTEGRFDPTLLGAVVRAGYDRSFELLAADAPTDRASTWDGLELGASGIEIDEAASTVTVPEGVGFDPGGIGKGLAADLVALELRARGALGVCVNLGGDLRVDGEGPGDGSWRIGVEHPLHGGRAGVLSLRSGGVATSSRTRRTWGPADDRRHHLIDPRTGRPAVTGLASATVVSGEAWRAEVLSKAAFMAGPAEGLFVLASAGAEGLLVDDAGSVYPTFGVDRFLVPEVSTPADRGRLAVLLGGA